VTSNAERYPWDNISRISHADARLLTALARGLAGADRGGAPEIAASLLGTTVTTTGIEPARAHRPSALAAFVELSGDASIVVEIPGTLASWTVDRALGSDATFASLDAGLGVRDEVARGVLAYVMTRLLHLLPDNYRVDAVDIDLHSVRARLEHRDARCFALSLIVESVHTSIHLWLLGPVVTPNTVTHRISGELAALLLLERAVLSAQLMATIRLPSGGAVGLLLDDVVMLQAAGVTACEGGYRGEVKLAVLGARTNHWIASAHGDRLELQQRHSTGGDRMTTGKINTESTSPTEALAAVTDAPLELSIEIARFTLPLGEIAKLTSGDVLLTGKPIGEHVTLRAGTVAIATGELVNVDGSIGVRIVTLVGG